MPGPADITYQWQRCSPSGDNCNAISGATAAAYPLVTADAGRILQVVARARNSNSSVTATTATGTILSPAVLADVPTISGTMIVGQVLKAAASASGTPAPTVAYQWQHCDASGGSCTDVVGATGPQRTLAASDAGDTLRVVASASNGVGPSDTRRSAATAVVVAPASSGSSNASFESSAPTSPEPVVDAQGTKSKPPFPQVRIRGRLRRGGARVTLFSVKAPKGWRVDARCKGRGCPRRKVVVKIKSSSIRLRQYERFLRTGIKLSLRISLKNATGKYSTLQIRSKAAPKRRDLCLPPNSTHPAKCVA
jgi:hypothetical protein